MVASFGVALAASSLLPILGALGIPGAKRGQPMPEYFLTLLFGMARFI